MRLKLHITTKLITRHGYGKQEFIFAIVDLDKASTYPANFVCVLPRLALNSKPNTAFRLTFGEQSLQIAKKLLTNALEDESELAIREEIYKRLSDLTPRQAPKAKCKRCGNFFEVKSFGRYQQQICQVCKNKSPGK